MNLEEYRSLPEVTQLGLLHACAVYLAKRRQGKFYIHLYQLEGFYIELCFEPNNPKMKKLVCFDSTDLIEPYLDKISLSNLMI